MPTPLHLVRGGLVAALTGTSLLVLSPVPSHAAPVFAEIYSDANQERGWSGSCTDLNPGWGVYPDIDLPENGGPVVNDVTTSTKVQATGDATDVITNVATYRARQREVHPPRSR